MAILSNEQVERLYDKNAGIYDRLVSGFRWAGLGRWRRDLVNRLELKAGDHVIDLCAVTGANLAFLLERVGPSGKVTLVDLSQGMLDQARRRAKRLRASNVEFVQSDVAAFRFPSETSAVISTFRLEMPPDYAAIIERASAALPTGGRMALLGLKHPERWPRWLIEIGIFATKPFGVSREYEEFRPWLPARRELNELHFREFLAGCAYEFGGAKS